MRILYFDCVSGISGDMVIASLIDAGADPEYLEKELKKLNLSTEYEIGWEKIIKNGITSTKFDVLLTNSSEAAHVHTSSDHHHHHHRDYLSIVSLIKETELDDIVKGKALKIFRIIGEAEGKIHGIPLNQVHFHEVGSIDSIIDIVGASILMKQLSIDKVMASTIPVGGGKIRIDHGIYPVPAPATLEILKGIPIESTPIKAELTTPTGAGIVSANVESFGPFPNMTVESIGYGAGTKTFQEHPNVLRVIIGEQNRPKT